MYYQIQQGEADARVGLTFNEIQALCPKVGESTLRARLRRGVFKLGELRAKPSKKPNGRSSAFNRKGAFL